MAQWLVNNQTGRLYLVGVRLPSATAPSDPNIAKLYTIDAGTAGAS